MPGKEDGPRLNLTRRDIEFGKRQEKLAKLCETIDWLEKRNLGRAITASYFQEETEDTDETFVTKTIGYALPLKFDNTQHLMVFKNGEMLMTRPPNGKTEEAARNMREGYQDLFTPSTVPYDVEIPEPKADMFEDIPDVIALMRLHVKQVPVVNQETQAEEYAEAFQKGIRIGKIQKIRRERARDARIDKLIDIWEKSFKEEDEPPPVPPQQSPTP